MKTENGISDHCVGSGYIDIEVNVMTEEQVSRKPHPGDKTPVIDYFICLKNDKMGNRKDTWITTSRLTGMQMTGREQLEKDMFQALDEYVKKHGFNYDQPNMGGCTSHTRNIRKKNK